MLPELSRTPASNLSPTPQSGINTSHAAHLIPQSVATNVPDTLNVTRFSLHIRQQPRAARAGPDGKDRRTIDPPPILQLQITDFDPESPQDIEDLKNSFFVVHCRLCLADHPRKDVSAVTSTGEDGTKEVHRLLMGTNVSSPFFCNDDPDPPTAAPHPSTKLSIHPPLVLAPQSMAPPERRNHNTPVTFFIFADLSVRKAGDYRLEFQLMRVDEGALAPGSTLPILNKATSEVFHVVNAKDFDQVQPSTSLVRGLIDRGAGFPLKLKKGPRESKRQKHSEDGEDDD